MRPLLLSSLHEREFGLLGDGAANGELVSPADDQLRANVEATYARARRLVFDLPVRPSLSQMSSEQVAALADFADAEAALQELRSPRGE